jgi:hypothetical protein
MDPCPEPAAPPRAILVRPPDPGRSQHCLLFAVDVAGFGRRDDEVQLNIRTALYRVLIAAFRAGGIAWENCHHEDRGDGVLVIVPLHMPTVVVFDPLLPRLEAGLRRHNRLSCAVAQIRLRVAVHVGEVHRDRHGVAGTAVNHLFRLLDAPAVRAALAASRGELTLIVSHYVYDSVLRHAGARVALTAYRPVDVAVKETRTPAWVQTSSPRPVEDLLPEEPVTADTLRRGYFSLPHELTLDSYSRA